MKNKTAILAGFLAACATFSPLSSHAGTLIATGDAVVPPSGFIRFCVKHSEDCLASGREHAVVDLTAERRAQLDAVQARINAAIAPREELGAGWRYATDGYGDCNTYALSKRRALIAMGWPEETLLLATAYTERDEGHLVLIARTNQGDLVLDNRLAPVVDWAALPYHWISMQSQKSPALWVQIVPRNLAKASAKPILVVSAER